jgi:hypothetical protein
MEKRHKDFRARIRREREDEREYRYNLVFSTNFVFFVKLRWVWGYKNTSNFSSLSMLPGFEMPLIS